MKLHILGSSSEGNGYILEAKDGALLIEAGLPFKAAKEALKFNTKKISGLIVSHAHKDHAGRLGEYIAAGIETYALADVFDSAGIGKRDCWRHDLMTGERYKIGPFTIFPMPAQHDAPCLAFVILHPEMGRLLFATDTAWLDFCVFGINLALIEVNFADDILQRNLDAGEIAYTRAQRVRRSHFSLARAKEYIRRARETSPYLSDILLLHLSSSNSDEARFIAEIQEAGGIPTSAAHAGEVLRLEKYDL